MIESFTRAAALWIPDVLEKEWYRPNPDPSITDKSRFLRDAEGGIVRDEETGLPLIAGRARPKQRPPLDFFIWLLLSGRGFGKSRSLTEWLDTRARNKKRGEQVLIAGRTPADVRDYELNGPGGLLTHHPDIVYLPSQRLLRWPNGVEGLIRSGANPEEFRGFSGDTAYLGELMSWDYVQACWDNLLFGMREGKNPQIGIATTPRPLKILKDIMSMPSCVMVRGSSNENRANLSENWAKNVLDPLIGTRLYRQEALAEILEDVEGALWRLSLIEETRVRKEDVPPLLRIAVGVDPQGVKAKGSTTGINISGTCAEGHLYVLEDASINGTPDEWAAAVVAAYERWEADAIVAEKNFGGDMVESTIRAVRKNLPVKLVVSSRGKRLRAEPVSALYPQGKAHHVGAFAALENEMTSFTPFSVESPNRLDALVFAATELVLTEVVKKVRSGVPGRWAKERS